MATSEGRSEDALTLTLLRQKVDLRMILSLTCHPHFYGLNIVEDGPHILSSLLRSL